MSPKEQSRPSIMLMNQDDAITSSQNKFVSSTVSRGVSPMIRGPLELTNLEATTTGGLGNFFMTDTMQQDSMTNFV